MKRIGPFLAGLFGWALACSIHPAQGAAPMRKTQSPGYYRMMLGNFEITALNDGVVSYETSQLFARTPAKDVKDSLAAMGQKDPVGMSYNAYLINTGRKLVLIDTGTGGKLDESPFFHGAGRVLANLRAAGYAPEQVDEIYITHLGPDHVGGLTRAGQRVFPNATVRAAKREMDIFLDPKPAQPPHPEALLQFWRGSFDPYIEAGKFTTFDRDIELVPGVRALATHGHTPGHTSYVVESESQSLVVLGDLVHVQALQFANPGLSSQFDADQNAAAQQRRRILQLTADGDYWVAGAHLSFPGLGHSRRDKAGYVWRPVNYAVAW